MENSLYNTTVNCPVCSKKFEVTKVRSKACKVQSRDTDMCVYYEGTNPILYDIWVCEHCGYASQQDKFNDINGRDSKAVLENISPRWTKRSLAGERSVENGIEAFKLALLNLNVKKAKASEIARICIRIAWLYRLNKDEREKEFLKFALRNYMEAYEKESFPADKLDESTCMYMIGELHRRTENYEEAIKWLSRLVSSPQARRNAKLLESARDQYQLAKEQLAGKKENAG